VSGPERERASEQPTSSNILIDSMFGLWNKAPFVKLELVEGDRRLHVLLDPAEAIRQATYLIEAATAARHDATFYTVAKSLGMDEDAAARFMVACRDALKEWNEMKRCQNCGQSFERMAYENTCSEPCHLAYIEHVVAQFGPTKRIVDAVTGKTHLVPTRDILERGVKRSDLPGYPEAARE
jgi:hypothetical protein